MLFLKEARNPDRWRSTEYSPVKRRKGKRRVRGSEKRMGVTERTNRRAGRYTFLRACVSQAC